MKHRYYIVGSILLMFTLAVPSLAASATIVTTTITGYIYGSGTNSHNGDTYGNGKIFGPSAHLDGLPFKLVYTFDTTLGTPEPESYCSDRSIEFSGRSGSTSTSNPGTATLYVYAKDGVRLLGSFTISSSSRFPPTSISSLATRYYDGDCGTNENARWNVQATYAGYYDGSASLSFEAFPKNYPARGERGSCPSDYFLSCSGDWTTAISKEDIYSSKNPTQDRFSIFISHGSTDLAVAYGYLTTVNTTTTYTVTNN